MTPIPKWLRFTSRATKRDWIRLLTRFGGASLLIFLICFVALVEVTSQPSFCRSCHNMEPYYQSWKTSAHKDIDCTECHMTPGVRGTIQAKTQGLSQMAKYFTGTAGTLPWAEVEDASCLRSGCHEARLLEGKVDFNGIAFDHTPHLTKMRRGKQLKCTSCHSQVVMGEHMKVTASTCVLCHFKNEPIGEPIGGCKGCHGVPTDTISLPGGRVFLHAEVVDRGVKCISCHASLTTGDGFVPRSRCFVCHNFPIDDLMDSSDFLHSKHVTQHKVECSVCHEEITHGYESKRRIAKLECGSCHAGQHDAEKNLAEGTAASVLGETEPRVGPMLAARVECVGCHIDIRNNNGRDTYEGQTRHGGSKACVTCHGDMAKNMLTDWKAFFAKRIAEVERAIASSRVGSADKARAKDMVERVRHGRAVHNPTLARDLLLEAERIVKGGPARAAREPLGPAVSGGGMQCRYCHIEAPQGAIRFEGATFLHEPHTGKMRLPCEKCHEPGPATFPQGPHGQTKLTKTDCATCHHWQRENCSACHGSGPSSAVSFDGIAFPHPRHTAAGVDCKTCHMKTIRGERRLSAIDIGTCASCHHKPGNPAKCETCHKVSGGSAPIPEAANFRNVQLPHQTHIELGIECRDCHKTAGPGTQITSVCMTCHHEEGMKPACEACHGSGPASPMPTYWKPFPHVTHAPLGLSCGDCHSKADPTKVDPPCATCHEEAVPTVPTVSATDSPAVAP